MGILGNDIAAAVFRTVEEAEEGWAALNDAGIPATVVTDPGIFGPFSVNVMVERVRLQEAQAVLAPIVNRDRR
jgi:hypothetical protein